MTSKPATQCAYCDEPATTRDHIPPKNLFARPLPEQLITVPACKVHNNGASLDDEYFRAMLSFRMDAHEKSDASGAAKRALDRMSRKESERFLRKFVSTITQHEIVTPEGGYIGDAAAYDVDMPRLLSVVERIVRGLFFHHTDGRLPDECTVTVYPLEFFQKPDRATFERLASLITWAASAPRHVTARNVLEYKFRQTPEDPAGTVWMMKFYETVPFLAITARSQPAASVV